jgi:integrase
VATRKRTRSNGEGGVWEDKGRHRWVGRYTIGFDENGRQVRRTVTGRTKREVLERLAEVKGAVDEGRQAPDRRLTVGGFLDQWLGDILPGTVAPATEVQYRDVVRLYVKPHLGRRQLVTLSVRDVSRMLRDLEEEGRSPNTRRLARSVLRRALRWAEAEGMVARNVAAIASGVRIGAAEGRTLTPAEARQLLAAVAGTRLEAAYAVALALGVRRGELLGLAWSDIDLDATPARVTVRRALKRLPAGLVLEDTKTPRVASHRPPPGARRHVPAGAQAQAG